VDEAFIPALLRERAALQPDDTAFTFLDYDQDWNGVVKSLTWPQVYRQVLNVAAHLGRYARPGDRAAILAPQGLEYIVGFLGAIQAGLIAVPLSAPLGGVADERIDAVLADAAPAVVLTTSAVAGAVAQSIHTDPGPALIELDTLDLDGPVSDPGDEPVERIAYLQYTSGSTRRPAGAMITHRNLVVNFDQLMRGYFPDTGGICPEGTTAVSWLPFYHDLGLVLGIFAPVVLGIPALLTSPLAFLQRPARWVQMLADGTCAFSAAPNFAFELAARKTTDADLEGRSLAGVERIVNGAERVQPATLNRFAERFAPFGFRPEALQPAYGLAEATLYVATCRADRAPEVVHFDSEKLVRGLAQRCGEQEGTPLVSYPMLTSPTVRIVDPQTRTECPDGSTGEIWVHGDNVAIGYWGRPEESERTFGGELADPSPGTPQGPWLRTGDLGFLYEGELFIVGRIKDLLIINGRNHAPDDIEATVADISGGRVAAIAVPTDGTEQLVVVAEVKKRGDTDEEIATRLAALQGEITSAVTRAHGIATADVVLVAPGTLPITTSGKIRRAACVELYRQNGFARLV